MRGYLDIYGLTAHRDEETINRFLDTYADRETAEEKLAGEELGLVPLGRKHHATRYLSDEVHQEALLKDAEYRKRWHEYDREPAHSLANIVKRGLDYPRRGFTVYLPHGRKDLHLEMSVILSFTVDDQVIFGLAMRDTDKNIRRAKDLLRTLMAECRCHLGMIAAHLPPPISEKVFRECKDKGFVLLFLEGPPEVGEQARN